MEKGWIVKDKPQVPAGLMKCESHRMSQPQIIKAAILGTDRFTSSNTYDWPYTVRPGPIAVLRLNYSRQLATNFGHLNI